MTLTKSKVSVTKLFSCGLESYARLAIRCAAVVALGLLLSGIVPNQANAQTTPVYSQPIGPTLPAANVNGGTGSPTTVSSQSTPDCLQSIDDNMRNSQLRGQQIANDLVLSNYRPPAKTSSMFCIGILTGAFDIINTLLSAGSMLATALIMAVGAIINAILDAVCQLIQNAISQLTSLLCIPIPQFGMGGLNLPSLPGGYCDGFQLINIPPGEPLPHVTTSPVTNDDLRGWLGMSPSTSAPASSGSSGWGLGGLFGGSSN